MPKQDNLKLGKSGELLACNFLKKQGYQILAVNFRTKLGEIDIIAKDKDVLCFIEVKTRHDASFGAPIEAISRQKVRKITQIAQIYLKSKRLFDCACRFDVVSVLAEGKSPVLELCKDAFNLDNIHG